MSRMQAIDEVDSLFGNHQREKSYANVGVARVQTFGCFRLTRACICINTSLKPCIPNEEALVSLEVCNRNDLKAACGRVTMLVRGTFLGSYIARGRASRIRLMLQR